MGKYAIILRKCASPKKCELCGKTEGEALEHEWVDATCSEAKHCAVCGKKEGKPLEHTVYSWSTDSEATSDTRSIQNVLCSHHGCPMIYLFVFNYFCFRVHYLLTSAIAFIRYSLWHRITPHFLVLSILPYLSNKWGAVQSARIFSFFRKLFYLPY